MTDHCCTFIAIQSNVTKLTEQVLEHQFRNENESLWLIILPWSRIQYSALFVDADKQAVLNYFTMLSARTFVSVPLTISRVFRL